MTAEKFWSKVNRRGPDDCWEWMNSGTYGHFYIGKGQARPAHRIAYELTYGDIPVGLCVCHHCDNPPCCNPTHLFVGTVQDNMRDKVAKGRGKRTPKPKRQMKRLGIGKAYHDMLSEMAKQESRTISKQAEWLILAESRRRNMKGGEQ